MKEKKRNGKSTSLGETVSEYTIVLLLVIISIKYSYMLYHYQQLKTQNIISFLC